MNKFNNVQLTSIVYKMENTISTFTTVSRRFVILLHKVHNGAGANYTVVTRDTVVQFTCSNVPCFYH